MFDYLVKLFNFNYFVNKPYKLQYLRLNKYFT